MLIILIVIIFMINTLNQFNEIILIGSGKGVASVKTINDVGWKRKSALSG